MSTEMAQLSDRLDTMRQNIGTNDLMCQENDIGGLDDENTFWKENSPLARGDDKIFNEFIAEEENDL